MAKLAINKKAGFDKKVIQVYRILVIQEKIVKESYNPKYCGI